MAPAKLIFFLGVVVFVSRAALREPVSGDTPANALIFSLKNQMSYSDPSIPAAFQCFPQPATILLSGQNWYSRLSSGFDNSFRQASIGASVSLLKRFAVKTTYSRFNALDLYFEDELYGSFGTRIFGSTFGSIELHVNRASVRSDEKGIFFTDAGMSVLQVGDRAILQLSAERLLWYLSAPEVTLPPSGTILLALHSRPAPVGSYSVGVRYVLENSLSFYSSLTAAVGEKLFLTASAGSRPVAVHFAVEFLSSAGSTGGSFLFNKHLGSSEALQHQFSLSNRKKQR